MIWTAADIPGQRGKTALVTGANSGIGRVTALELAKAGARVIMAGRSETKLQEAAASIRAEVPGAELDLLPMDLSDLSSVEKAAASLSTPTWRLDLLVNNAGVMAVPERRTTADGFELTFGTNHLGHFALTGHVMPALLKAAAPRVVTVSAIAYGWKSGELTDVNSETDYRPMSAYAKSKRANVVFTQELARRFSKVTAVAVHPGSSLTGLQQHMPRWMQVITSGLVGRLMFQPTDQAAWSSLYAATEPDLASGAFVGPGGRGGMRGAPVVLDLPDFATDPVAGRDLWIASERMTGVFRPYAFSQVAKSQG